LRWVSAALSVYFGESSVVRPLVLQASPEID
jgi:hypothetical protein